MERKRNKKLLLKGERISVKCEAYNVPSRDASIDINLNCLITLSEAKLYEQRIKKIANEWYNESISLDPKHMICIVSVPDNYKGDEDKKWSMVLKLQLSILLREDIVMGANPFPERFKEELAELMNQLSKID